MTQNPEGNYGEQDIDTGRKLSPALNFENSEQNRRQNPDMKSEMLCLETIQKEVRDGKENFGNFGSRHRK